MKLLKTCLFIAIAFGIVSACSSKKDESVAEDEGTTAAKEWKEMDNFHMIMAETFHPYKDSMNLAPLKSQIADLTKAANDWVGAALPEKVDNDEMKAMLQQLKSDCESLSQLVPVGSDEEIGVSLTNLHDRFHKIQEAWYGGAAEHSEGEHGHEHH